MSRYGTQKLYIDGRYQESTGNETFDAINPANGEVIATLPKS